jgi:apolipoprotein N-acyltransferase
MVALIIGINMHVAHGLYYYRPCSVGWAGLLLMPFLAGLTWQKPETVSPWIASIAIILPDHMPCHPRAAALAINETIEHINDHKSGAALIIAGEASYPFWLNENMHAIDLWRQTLDKNQQIIIGSHRKEALQCYNSLFCIGTKGISNHYDKKYLMPFVEYVPWPWQYASLCKNFFLKDKKEFFPNQNSSVPISTDLGLCFQPLICSDLFFGPAPSRYSCPLLCIANDGWFRSEYFPELMVLFARLTAIEQRRELIYVSHRQGYWIGKSGQSVCLKTYPLLI